MSASRFYALFFWQVFMHFFFVVAQVRVWKLNGGGFFASLLGTATEASATFTLPVIVTPAASAGTRTGSLIA